MVRSTDGNPPRVELRVEEVLRREDRTRLGIRLLEIQVPPGMPIFSKTYLLPAKPHSFVGSVLDSI